MKAYLLNLGTALSQLLHAVFGGNAKVTTSARLGKQVLRGERWATALCAVISFVFRDERHCTKAFEKDRARATCAHEE